MIAKIYLKEIRENAKRFRALGGGKLCAVVKANAYGHGAEEVAFALSGVADFFAVALLEEALSLRVAACGTDILILTPPQTQADVLCAAQNGFVLTVPDYRTASLIAIVGRKYQIPVRVHLKTNTGMNRYGMNASLLGKVCTLLVRENYVRVEGVFSHLYSGEHRICERQRNLFLSHIAVCKRYFPDVLCHLSATHGATLGKDFAFDMLRVGLGLYGYLPNGAGAIPFSLGKGMEVFAETVMNRKYSFGGAGYGESERIEKGETLSVLRYGYADGFLRTKRNGLCGSETHANNLCMDACVRKGKTPVGKLVPVMINAEETARETGTIAYEVLCAATRRAECLYVYE